MYKIVLTYLLPFCLILSLRADGPKQSSASDEVYLRAQVYKGHSLNFESAANGNDVLVLTSLANGSQLRLDTLSKGWFSPLPFETCLLLINSSGDYMSCDYNLKIQIRGKSNMVGALGMSKRLREDNRFVSTYIEWDAEKKQFMYKLLRMQFDNHSISILDAYPISKLGYPLVTASDDALIISRDNAEKVELKK